MARKSRNINPLVKKNFEENDINNIAEAQSLMKDMVSLMLEAEMDETLGYSKYERRNAAENSRNGYNDKKVKTSLGEVELVTEREPSNLKLFLNIPVISRI